MEAVTASFAEEETKVQGANYLPKSESLTVEFALLWPL